MDKDIEQIPKSHTGPVVFLLILGLAILAVAGFILLDRQESRQELEPKPLKSEKTLTAQKPLEITLPPPAKQVEADDAGPAKQNGKNSLGKKKTVNKQAINEEKLGEIDARVVRNFFNQKFPEVRSCYERRLKINSFLEGKLDLTMKIGTSGKVKAIKVNSDTIHDSEMNSCVKQVISQWDFPKPEGGPVIVSKTFSFQKAD